MHPDTALLDQATLVSRAVIRKNFTARGLSAAADGYPQVWARDAVITLLGASIGRDPEVMAGFRVSLETLAAAQDRFGQIPFNVLVKTGQNNFGNTDANPWFVIGASLFAELAPEDDWTARRADVIVRALDWCESQDPRKQGLIISDECSDWADLLGNHGAVLFPNVLYAHALRAALPLLRRHAPAEVARFEARRELVLRALQERFWISEPNSFRDDDHFQVRQKACSLQRFRPYFGNWSGVAESGDRFDVTANLLAILGDVATPKQAGFILNYIEQTGVNRPYPVQVLYPAIQPGEPEWREYYKLYNLNRPHHYHNGGIWPWVGGAYVAALVKAGRREEAARELVKLAESLRVGLGREQWECNEWLHGVTGQAMGFRDQAWSAGMFLYARHAVETGETPGFASAASADSVTTPPLAATSV